MAGIKAYLTKKDKADLMEFIAYTGENYDRYLEWCTARAARPFTKGYLHNWIGKRREYINDLRRQHREEARKISVYGRERRLEELERISEYLLTNIEQMQTHGVCSPVCRPIETVLKLMEQHRKTMESIAKERGEFNKPDQQPNDRDSRFTAAKREALQRLSSGRKIYVIQPNSGEVELGDSEESVGE